MTLRVALADDHPVFLDGLRLLLESAGGIEVVATAADGAGLLDALLDPACRQVDVAVVDVDMPSPDGVEVTARLVRERPDVRVLLLTMHADGATVSRALRVGARGYILKGASTGSIVRAVHAVADGDTVLGGEVGRVVAQSAALSPALRATVDGVTLTDRDRDVLALVARGHSNGQIAAELHLSVKTVQNYVSSLLTRSGSPTRAALVSWARDRAGS
jgi:DNA-binding NarL/FixJ family response regulator